MNSLLLCAAVLLLVASLALAATTPDTTAESSVSPVVTCQTTGCEPEYGCKAEFGGPQCVALPDQCLFPADSGPCKANIPSYYYNSSSQSCEPFTYGGCEGNANRYPTIGECYQSCQLCELTSVTGPCFGYFPSYFFNSTSGKCEQFTYGGCRGNANRFENLEECGKNCDLCKLPPVTGPCRAHIIMFFYNSTSAMCEEFVYGGCHGNANRFETAKECRNTCNRE